jgi:zinc transport system permease protein
MSFLGFEFMQRALVAAALVGLAAPAIGTFLVQRGLSLMGDGIGHVAFMGVAAGLLLGISPLVSAMVVAALGAFVIEVLRQRGRTASDVALALIFYGGIAGGALLTYLSGESNRILSYLFGSILLVDTSELILIGVVATFVVVLTLALSRALFAIAYDEEVARVAGLPVTTLNMLVALLAAVTIGVTMRVVGLLLVSAMLVLPVAAVQPLTRSFRGTMFASLGLGVVVSVVGLIAAFYADVAPGATIVLTAILAFVIASAFGRVGAGSVRRERSSP